MCWEAALMLGLMIHYVAENATFWIFAEESIKINVNKDDGILKNVKVIGDLHLKKNGTNFPFKILDKMMQSR